MERLDGWQRMLVAAAAIFGFAGVALSAMAAHMPDPRFLGQAGLLCLAHGPALLALASYRLRLAKPAAILMILGTALFTLDMLFRNRMGSGLFPMSAPTGGMAIMLGWLTLLLAAIFPNRRS
jgi:uncharacterized membrane protein YgdD (TMEM256/DUF423 family)